MKYNVVRIRKPISLQALDVTEPCFIIVSTTETVELAQIMINAADYQDRENFIILQSFEK